MASTPTVIPDLTGEQFANRIAELFPRDWGSDDAKQSGNVFAVFLCAGEKLRDILLEIQYAAAAQRLTTETVPELDLASVDFLGDLLPRPSGMSDSDFADLIIANLFQTAATRSALQNAITRLTGVVPRMLEPWRVQDTGVWGRTSYWNVDTVANPARWAGAERYQGYIETIPAPIPAIGVNNPILTWGTAYWNVPGYFFGIISADAARSVYDVLNRIRAYGTIVWVRLLNQTASGTIVAPSSVRQLASSPAGSDRVTLTWLQPTTGTAPFNYLVQYRQQGAPTFQPGPSVSSPPVTVASLQANQNYEFTVTVSNSVGSNVSNITTATTLKVPPSQATGLQPTQVQPNAVTLTWTAPSAGTPPFNYTVQYQITGSTQGWSLLPVGGSIGVTVLNLQEDTTYDFEVVTTNV